MKKLLFVYALVVLMFTAQACAQAQRDGLLQDAGDYVQAPQHPDGSVNKDEKGQPVLDGKPDYKAEEVIVAAAEKGLSKAATGDWIGLIGWALFGAVTLGIGWFKRRAIIEKLADKPKDQPPTPPIGTPAV